MIVLSWYSYLNFSHSDRKFEFVVVDNFEGEGSGLGYTMRAAKECLKEEFIFVPNDTIIETEDIQIQTPAEKIKQMMEDLQE